MMKFEMNLASEPFRRDRAILIASGAVGALLVLSLAALVSLILMDRGSMSQQRAALARLNRQLDRIASEQRKVDGELRKPENSEVLERSVFLNTLLYRKGISWTKIFADLEKTLPDNVRVIAIRPQVNARDQIFLEMTVGADSPANVIAFLTKLEASDLFGSTKVNNIQPPSQTDPLYRYTVSVNYAQKF
ncbi:MAG: PilN domain-containing protein [Bryobacteraceae bacterium]